MANFCFNCGSPVNDAMTFCPSCGCALNGGAANNGAAGTAQQYNADTGINGTAPSAADVLGTLVAVSLVGGMTRQLYYYGGRYFLDPYCRSPFATPHMIVGRHRLIRPVGRPVGRPPMGRPPIGRPPMGGPRGGGPRGRR